ncbi:MAG: DNA translocase FtsK [Myxococcales bacterium]|nr:DNA translocase FtsK [Myxococcales bacterium]
MAKKTVGEENRQPGKGMEIAGVLVIILAAMLGLALLSHYVSDPSYNTVAIPDTYPQNMIGRFGAHTSDLLLQIGGIASVMVPLMLVFIGLLLYRRRLFKPALGQIFGYLILMIVVACILAMFLGQEGGGIAGKALADLLTDFLGRVGGLLLVGGLAIVALILSVDFSFIKMLRGFRAYLAGLVDTLRSRWTIRREARRRRQRRDQRAVETGAGPERPAPIIRHGIPETAEPLAKEAKKHRKADAPVRTTRLDQVPEPTPEPFAVDEFEPAPPPPPPPPRKAKDADVITIHQKAETETARQISFSGLSDAYSRPPLDLFQRASKGDKDLDREALLAQSVALESKLETFGITGKVVEIYPGPVITMFEYEPSAGIKISRIANLEDDLAMALQAEKIRIIAPIPGKGAVGIEVPSLRREIVYLREILESKEFNEAKSPLTIAFGKDSTGRPMVQDLARMPHLLVAGTTGSGKSVFLNGVIMSLIFKTTPDQVRLLMVDPKQLELSMYTDTPHMLHPVITEPKKAALLLRWAVAEMEDRYRKMAEQRVRNIDSYNAKIEKAIAKTPRKGKLTGEEAEPIPEKLPYIVIILDELADLMMIAAKEVEEFIARLAQMARAAGIHLIIATQRPSVDVITGVIKANFPSRISFQVRTRVDSRTILDETGANNLLGMGDALFLPPGAAKISRFHAAFVSDEEVQGIVHHLKEKNPRPQYAEIRTATGTDLNNASLDEVNLDDDDGDVDEGLFDKAVDIVARERKASVSYIQRRLKIGYNRSARIIERMEREGMISTSDGTSRPREIYLPETNYDD